MAFRGYCGDRYIQGYRDTYVVYGRGMRGNLVLFGHRGVLEGKLGEDAVKLVSQEGVLRGTIGNEALVLEGYPADEESMYDLGLTLSAF